MNKSPAPTLLPAHSGGIRSDFNILVHDVSRLLTTIFDRKLKPLEVTRAQWWALSILAIPNETAINQSDLATLISSTKASAGKIIVKLEKAGLIKRSRSTSDHRVQFLEVTSNGQKLLHETRQIEESLARRVTAGINKQDIETACGTLLFAKDNIGEKLNRSSEVLQTTHLIQKMESARGQRHPNFVGFLVHDVARMRRTIMDKLLQPSELNRSQWRVLSYLFERDGMTQISLARDLSLSRSALGTLVQKLEERQFLSRMQDPEDERKFRILLTKSGTAKVRSIRRSTSMAQDYVLAGLSDDDIRTTVNVLESLKSNIVTALRQSL